MRPIPLWQWIPRARWRVVGKVENADEIPDRIPRNGVVVVAENTTMKWAALDCPCGQGHRLMVNLDARRSPVWRLSGRRLSVWPSFDYQTPEKRCHFILRDGRIKWVPNLRTPDARR